MRKNMLTVLILLFSLVLITGLVAEEKQVLPISSLTEREFVSDNSKPGGIVVGPAMPRAFHYGGRQAVRDLDGYLHVTWEDPTYDFNYYSRSTDFLGLEWTAPVNPHLLNGIKIGDNSLQYEIDRALMAKMAVDPRTGYLYMMPFTRWNAGERYKTSISRSVDGGATWSHYTDLGSKIGRPTEEVSWGTMTIGYDPTDALKTIFHIAYSKDNQDIMYTRADLSVIDAVDASIDSLVFTKSDGVTVGDEAISYVPSGVVFQGTIVLDRN
ncbi:MAG: exo-alpha-sialidase, partial [Candidatus Marinimicrobia bacterium]|nr:exo-alpha-sialidase [Candidatus Neomarinimicrobiota bacterium]